MNHIITILERQIPLKIQLTKRSHADSGRRFIIPPQTQNRTDTGQTLPAALCLFKCERSKTVYVFNEIAVTAALSMVYMAIFFHVLLSSNFTEARRISLASAADILPSPSALQAAASTPVKLSSLTEQRSAKRASAAEI